MFDVIPPTDSGLGALLRSHRAHLGLTQEEVAERAEMSARALRELEAGRVERPRRDSIRRLAEALELDDQERRRLEDIARHRPPPGAAAPAATAAMSPAP